MSIIGPEYALGRRLDRKDHLCSSSRWLSGLRSLLLPHPICGRKRQRRGEIRQCSGVRSSLRPEPSGVEGFAASIVGQRDKPGSAMLWIEAQSTPIITLLVLSGCYMLTATIICLVATLSRGAVDLRAVAPVTLTPLGVILGLLLAFLASRVWTNLDRAGEYVGQEAGALRETVLLADSLPQEVRTSVRQAIRRHLHLIESEEWPAMAHQQLSMHSIPVGLAEALTAVLSFAPTQANQQLAQERAVVAIEHALEARRNRVRLSQAEIAPMQWIVIVVLAVLILVTIALIHIASRLAMLITMFIFSTAIAVCLVLLMVYDRPFGPGGFVIQPTVLRDVMPD